MCVPNGIDVKIATMLGLMKPSPTYGLEDVRRAARRGDRGDVAVGVKAKAHLAAAGMGDLGDLGDAACGIALVGELLGECVGDGLHKSFWPVAYGERAQIGTGTLGGAGDAATYVVGVVHGFDIGDLGESLPSLGIGFGGGTAGDKTMKP